MIRNQFQRNPLAFGGTLVLLLICIWAGWWFFTNFERAYREGNTSVSPEARKNPLLAAERLLELRGTESQGVSGRDILTNPPEQSGVLLVRRLGRELLPDQQRRLLDWVDQGGRLILVPPLFDAEDDTLADSEFSFHARFGVRRISRDIDCEDDEDIESLDSCMHQQVKFESPDLTRPLTLEFSRRWALFDDDGRAEWKLPGEQGFLILNYRQGNGSVTLLSDNSLFDNDEIGKHDHAALLTLLIDDDQPVFLLYSSDMPDLATLLWRNLPELVLTAPLALILFLRYLTGFTGPRRPLAEHRRRNLIEHLRAAARYLWSVDRAAALLEGTRAELLRDWQRRHPQLARLGQSEQHQHMAQLSGLHPREVAEALTSTVEGPTQLIRTSSLLQRLHKMVRGSSRPTSSDESL